jgi:hypothetical protein
MRKLNLLFATLAVFAGMGAIAQETVPVNADRDEMTIRPIGNFTGTIAIDGKADEAFWGKIAPLDLPHDVTDSWFTDPTTNTTPGEDLRVSWKITMDKDNFYIFCDITDNFLASRSMDTKADQWVNDNIELFFLFADTTVVMPAWSLTDATQFRIWPDLDEVTGDSITAGGWCSGILNLAGTKYQTLGYKSKTLKTDKGYTVEAKIPFTLIIPSVDAALPIDSLGYLDDDDRYVRVSIDKFDVFQFDINVADRDDAALGAQREDIWSWSAKWNRNWGFTIGYGNVNIGRPLSYPETTEYGPDSRAELFIKPIAKGLVTIDGKSDEEFWGKIENRTLPLDVTNSWFSSSTIAAAPGSDLDVKWKAAIDEENFYIYCDVTDESLVSRSMVTKADQWVNDNIELFFLFADSAVVMPAWSLTEATQFRIWPDLDEVTGDSITAGGWCSGVLNTAGTKYQTLGYKSKTIKTEKGYTTEAKIPLALIVPSVDTKLPIDSLGFLNDDDQFVRWNFNNMKNFQFDINVADRDDAADGKEREYIWGWSADWNRNWGFTRGYGYIKIQESGSTSVPEAVLQTSKIRMYPNPVKDALIIDNLEGENLVHLYNMYGQMVYSSVCSDASTELNVKDLKKGMYIIRVTAENGKTTVGKILKQ